MWGEIPVNTAVRDGLQAGAGQWALSKRTPDAAKRSRFGVLAWGCPPRQPTQSFRSSIAMNRTFGFPLPRTMDETKNRPSKAKTAPLRSACPLPKEGIFRKIRVNPLEGPDGVEFIIMNGWESNGSHLLSPVRLKINQVIKLYSAE